MKILYLAIIIGIGIATIVTITTNLMVLQSADADSSLTIGIDKNVYGVGEPISFFVEIENENGLYPVASIVNEQNKTVWYDDDLPPNGYKGTTKVYYVEQNSENVPMINQTGKYTLIVTYGEKRASKDLTVSELVTEDNMIHFYGSYKGIDNDSGMVEIANRTYNFMTIHSAPSDLIVSNDTTITFQGISFTIPGCGKCLPAPMPFNPLQYIEVHFPDNTNETLAVRDNIWSTISGPLDSQEYFPNGTKIFPNGTKGTWHPRLHKDQIVTTFTRHADPQAGITVLHNSVKFLESTANQTSNQTFIGISNGETVTPLQTQGANGSNLVIHYEGQGVDVTGKIMPTGPPPQLDNPSPLPAIIGVGSVVGAAAVGITIFIMKKRK
ncbi:MAG: hypothetical protein KGI33_09135 [Thaumarchaeota archaeon]|nr:hypothetical protein [Nitrososphaerota archaeon]